MLRLIPEKEEMLKKIMNGTCKFNDEEDMINNYYGLCYLIAKVVGYDKK